MTRVVSPSPTLTVVTTTGGDESNGAGNSKAGHMYYVLTDSNGDSISFGFAPINAGAPFGAGRVINTDRANYATLIYSEETVNISQVQYNALANFGTEGAPGYLSEFSSHYNFLTNSCVDFVWAALSTIGIEEPDHFPGANASVS
jgi:hypothetical protein